MPKNPFDFNMSIVEIHVDFATTTLGIMSARNHVIVTMNSEICASSIYKTINPSLHPKEEQEAGFLLRSLIN